MSRPRRLDFHGAIHIVHVRGREGFNIFFDAHVLSRTEDRWRNSPHVRKFLQLLDECCSECGTEMFGYCIEPNEGSLLVKTLGAPLDACMRRLGGRYSRYLHHEQVVPTSACTFGSRYEAKVVAPEFLPHALRRLHAHPLISGLARRAIDYPFSSARAYLGEHSRVRIETNPLRKALELRGFSGSRGYREFMELSESGQVRDLFKKGSPIDARVIGSNTFVQGRAAGAGHPAALVLREQLIAGVAALLGVRKEQLFERSHQAVQGRALVASYALRFGVGSLTDVGGWFEVSGTALGKAIRHYRRVSPELFAMQALPGIEIADEEMDE
jgi:putative transposase